MSEIKVNCPVCGTKMSIESNNKVSKNINAKEPVAKSKTAEDKIIALRNAGVDVSNLFSIKSSNGDDAVGRLVNGHFTVIPENDPIFFSIMQSGTVPNRRLFRRWVMAQMFHMMTETDYNTKKAIGFTEVLNRKGYKYQWNMVVEEFRVQAKLFKNDPENFNERNRWFNKCVAINMGQHYIEQLKVIVKKLRVRNCKGVPYVRIQNRNVFVEDLQVKIYAPLEKALENIKKAHSASSLHNAIQRFHCEIKRTYMSHDIPQSPCFKDAYKGAGAFFTLKNLILFHGCTFKRMNTEKSLVHLQYLVDQDNCEGYKLLGVFKEFLKCNKIDLKKKQAEWRK